MKILPEGRLIDAQEIIPGLWVGSRDACAPMRAHGIASLCVLEKPCWNHAAGCIHKRILDSDSPLINGEGTITSKMEMLKHIQLNGSNNLTKEEYRSLVYVNDAWAQEALTIISNHQSNGIELLVHCAAGMERSPLIVAMWLRDKEGISLEQAYAKIKEKRPHIHDRTMWLSRPEEK